jgi:hypothetical protein
VTASPAALFTLGDWSIHTDSNTVEGPKFYANHKCTKYNTQPAGRGLLAEYVMSRFAWVKEDDGFKCYYCQKHVPDEIQGMLLMFWSGIKGSR